MSEPQRTVYYVGLRNAGFGWQRLAGPFHAEGPAGAALWRVLAADSRDDDGEDGYGNSPEVIPVDLTPGQIAEPGSRNDEFPPETITADYIAELEWQRNNATAYQLTINTPRGYREIHVEYRDLGDDEPSGWVILTGEDEQARILTRDNTWEPDRPADGWDPDFLARTINGPLWDRSALARASALNGVNIYG